MRQVRLQRAAVEWVRAQGGTVDYDDNRELGAAEPPGPRWLRSIAGIDFAARPVTVGLNNSQVVDVATLAKLTSLQNLYLSGTPVADVTPLVNLKRLKILYLSGTKVADVAPLAKLTGLQRLDLSGAPVSEESLAELQRALPSLRIIRW